MKVLMVTPFPEDPTLVRGGVEAAASRLATAMWAHFGLEYDLLVYEASSGKLSYERWPHINVLPIRPVRRGQRTPAHTIRRLVRQLERSRNYDVIHVQGPASFVSRSPRQLVTIHGISERDSLYAARRMSQKLRPKLVYLREFIGRRRARNVIAISKYVISVISHHNQRLWIIPNAVDPMFFSAVRKARAERIVLFAGRVVEIKNVLGLIAAFEVAWTRDSRLRLRIVGNGLQTAYGQICLGRASGFPAGVVTFVGECDTPTLIDEMSQAKLLALFSWQENAPMVIAEAFATGLPVVASGVGGVPEMVTNVNGELVEAGDEISLAAAIERVASWDLSVERTDAIRNSATHYRTESVARATYSAYEDICQTVSASIRYRENR